MTSSTSQQPSSKNYALLPRKKDGLQLYIYITFLDKPTFKVKNISRDLQHVIVQQSRNLLITPTSWVIWNAEDPWSTSLEIYTKTLVYIRALKYQAPPTQTTQDYTKQIPQVTIRH